MLLRVQVYMGWILTCSSSLANNNIPGQRKIGVLSVLPELLTTVSETNYLMDVNTDETPNLSLWESNRHLALRSPLSNRHWSCMASNCWGPVAENICPKTMCGGCSWHKGLPLPLALAEWWVEDMRSHHMLNSTEKKVHRLQWKCLCSLSTAKHQQEREWEQKRGLKVSYHPMKQKLACAAGDVSSTPDLQQCTDFQQLHRKGLKRFIGISSLCL